MRLIHQARGKVIAVEDRPFVDLTTHSPRARQKLAGIRVMNREPTLRLIKNTARNYLPGPFLEIADDGCRFTISEGVMCGAKANPGTAWCECHRKRVYEKRAKA